MTKQRKLILDIINSSDRHLTAEEVFFIAKEQMPGIAMATVYNNLNYLSCHNLDVYKRQTYGKAFSSYRRKTKCWKIHIL